MTTGAPVAKADPIIVLGAGVFGLSLALELNARGYHNITVLDRYIPPVPDGSSVDISRVVRSDYADPLYSLMAKEAIVAWRSEYQDCYHESGFAMLSETHNPYLDVMLEVARAEGRHLDKYSNANDLKKKYPALQSHLDGIQAIHNPEGGWADAELSIRHLSGRCSRKGISFILGPRGTVRKLRKVGSRVVGVDVASGDFIPAAQVIVSTGAWSNLLLNLSHAASASAQPVGFIQLTANEAQSLQNTPVMINMSSGVFCFPPTPDTHILKVARHSYGFANDQPTEDGSIVSSPKRDGNNAERSFLPDEADAALRAGLRQFVPQFAHYPWSKRRLCWYTDTVEGDFVVDYHPTLAGLFIATGGAGQ